MKKTAIITGIHGQDGSILAKYLLAKNYRVVGLVARQKKTATGLEGVEVIEIDITNIDLVRQVLQEICPNEFYHLAAVHHSSEQKSDEDMQDRMLRVNFRSTQTILDAISEICPKCRFLFAGSSQMYTPTQDITIVDENTPYRPSSYYGLMKVASAQLVDLMRRKQGLWAVTVILFNHESTRRNVQFVSRKVTRFAAQARHGIDADKNSFSKKLEINNLDARVDWSSATDFVAAFHLALTASAPTDYVLASGQVHSIRDLLKEAFMTVNLNWQDFVVDLSSTTNANQQSPCLQGDPQRALETLGWKPEKTFSALIREMVDFDLNHEPG